MELTLVGAAAFPAERWQSAAGSRNRRQIAQGIGRMGGHVQEDHVCHAHDFVSPCQHAHIVFRGALPLHGGNQRRYAGGTVAPQVQNFGTDAQDAPQRRTVLFLGEEATNGTFVL